MISTTLTGGVRLKGTRYKGSNYNTLQTIRGDRRGLGEYNRRLAHINKHNAYATLRLYHTVLNSTIIYSKREADDKGYIPLKTTILHLATAHA